MMFECDKCGICCQHIDLIPQLKDYDSGNGRCIHLLSSNLCEIYSNRPEVCNIEKMYELFYRDIISKDEYIQKNKLGCRKLKKKYAK